MSVVSDLSNTAKHWIDALAISSAGIAAVSLTQTAVALTVVASLVSIVLGGVRIYDRLKYGPLGRNE